MNTASGDIVLKGSAADSAGLVVGPLLIILITFVLGAGAAIDALVVLSGALLWAGLWLAAACGYGCWLGRWLGCRGDHAVAINMSLGIAGLLVIDAALGRLGVLQAGGAAGAWAVIAIGIGLLVIGVGRGYRAAVRRARAEGKQLAIYAPPWQIWTAAPAVAVLLLAAASAPGWLWASEFGGYDVMSYHLQLPKEWVALGAIEPLEHNVYSFFPNYMEGAFYHLMVVRGEAIEAVYAAQLLHAVMALLTAWLVWCFVKKQVGDGRRQSASVAAVVLLGTPWVIVVGSLAYNEMATALMLAAGLLVYQCSEIGPGQRGAALGVLAATACGAKLTAVGLVAVPLGIALLMSTPARQWLHAIAAGVAAGGVALSPYLIGNALACGNPVFPFATSIFGSGHWNEQQVEIWNRGHMSGLWLAERVMEAWHQLMRYGLGASPYEGEPWYAQWSILPWVVAAAVIVLWLVDRRDAGNGASQERGVARLLVVVVAIQVLFWIGVTHVKSRFMLPLVVPGGMIVGLAWAVTGRYVGAWARLREIGIGTLLTLWCIVPAVIFMRQAQGMPAARIGMASLLTGEGLSSSELQQVADVQPAIYFNHLLTEGSAVLLVGEAAPLYYKGSYVYQTTWDRGPLSRTIRRNGGNTMAWLKELRDQGFTHVLVNGHMLRRWEQAGWNDPLIAADRVMAFLNTHGDLIHSWPTGEQLYQLH